AVNGEASRVVDCARDSIDQGCGIAAGRRAEIPQELLSFGLFARSRDDPHEFFFFFQAEDGIRDWSVTGVQTCALPISFILSVALSPLWFIWCCSSATNASNDWLSSVRPWLRLVARLYRSLMSASSQTTWPPSRW